MKKALITGVTGQDGSYLTEFLLDRGYEVHGIIRRSSSFNTRRIDHLYRDPHEKTRLFLHYGDLTTNDGLTDVIYHVQPDEIYNLGAQSHVRVSFDMPEYTADASGVSVVRLLESIRRAGINTRFYQASTSELFGSALPPQSETTALQPQSPYAAAKLYAYWLVRNYRDGYKMHASNGILFNHESPRRGETFVTRKITRAVANIVAGAQTALYLGNIDSRRDWGYAPEFVECMWLILQQDNPDDYVIGTGEAHTIREFLSAAFGYVGRDYQDYVKIDPKYFRPTEVDYLLADPRKAREKLGWQPRVKFHELVQIMMDADLELLGLPCPGEGKKVVAERFDGNWHHWGRAVVSMENATHEI
ncbi:MAG: GDP-mannose 4,6-dehydratase [Planctomycetota bacterium]|jgi:GDPmannose 4,6-dehydratase|nr:GDP-mannose 4,6-dehydratase [Planctomycetota bacterium]